jgi:hypothetical protein
VASGSVSPIDRDRSTVPVRDVRHWSPWMLAA